MSQQTSNTTTGSGAQRATGDGGRSSAPRNPDQIERDIVETRRHLAGTIDEIGGRVAPKNVKRRLVEAVKGQVVNPDGTVRTERIAPVVGFVAVVVTVRGAVAWYRHRR